MPAIFSSDGRSFGFLKTEASVRMGLKAVFMLNCCSVRFTLSDTGLEHRVPRQGQQGQGGGFVGQTLFGQHFHFYFVIRTLRRFTHLYFP